MLIRSSRNPFALRSLQFDDCLNRTTSNSPLQREEPTAFPDQVFHAAADPAALAWRRHHPFGHSRFPERANGAINPNPYLGGMEELAGIVAATATEAIPAEERSWIGGNVSWLSKAPPAAATPRCGICGDPLQFAAQIYAPMYDKYRALHVFACEAHANVDKGWSVLRTQRDMINPVDTKPSAASRSKWTTASAWDDDDSDDPDDLEALLREHEHTNSESTSSETEDTSRVSTASRTTKTSLATPPGVPTVSSFRRREVVWVTSVGCELVTGDDDDEYDALGADDDEMLARAQAYLHADSELEASSRKLVACAIGGGTISELPTAAQCDEEYERVPDAAAASVAFANCLRRHPTQVIRYAYGATPLLRVLSRAAQPTIPRCECGARRCFELELLPTLIYYLNSDAMEDWNTVAVWSCDRSCDASDTEIAVVQPARLGSSSTRTARRPRSRGDTCGRET